MARKAKKKSAAKPARKPTRRPAAGKAGVRKKAKATPKAKTKAAKKKGTPVKKAGKAAKRAAKPAKIAKAGAVKAAPRAAAGTQRPASVAIVSGNVSEKDLARIEQLMDNFQNLMFASMEGMFGELASAMGRAFAGDEADQSAPEEPSKETLVELIRKGREGVEPNEERKKAMLDALTPGIAARLLGLPAKYAPDLPPLDQPRTDDELADYLLLQARQDPRLQGFTREIHEIGNEWAAGAQAT